MSSQESRGNSTRMVNLTPGGIEFQIEKLLLGKVLTIIDASYTDATQREAIKSLIKDKFHAQMDWMLDRLAVESSVNNEQ